MLFKVTSWGLLALAWAWVVFECKAAEDAHTTTELIASLGSSTDRMSADFSATPGPHPAIRFIGRHSTYVFPAGILAAAWCYALVGKLIPRQKS